MAIQLCKIRLVQINDSVIIAPRALSLEAVGQWYEKRENMEAWQKRLLGLTDKNPETGKTYAAEIGALNNEFSDLPLFLQK